MSKSPRHIVIVDDEVALGQICKELLTANGYQVTLYSRATDVLEDQTTRNVDLLITDVGLADKSGYQLATELNAKLTQNRKEEIPVIFISGGILPSINSKNTNCYYLEKPFSIYALLRQVQAVFEDQFQKQQAG
jgi:FixJ family two-component response regulator